MIEGKASPGLSFSPMPRDAVGRADVGWNHMISIHTGIMLLFVLRLESIQLGPIILLAKRSAGF
jgi:hypothetical protein